MYVQKKTFFFPLCKHSIVCACRFPKTCLTLMIIWKYQILVLIFLIFYCELFGNQPSIHLISLYTWKSVLGPWSCKFLELLCTWNHFRIFKSTCTVRLLLMFLGIGYWKSCQRRTGFCCCYCQTSRASCWTWWTNGVLSVQQCGCCSKFPTEWKSENRLFRTNSVISMDLPISVSYLFWLFSFYHLSYLTARTGYQENFDCWLGCPSW